MAQPTTSKYAKRGTSPNPDEMELEPKMRRTSSPLKNVDRSDYEKLSVFQKPCILVEIDREGQLKTCVKVLDELKQIEYPLNVIAITGPYRTGKSYLLNYLAGKRKGFPLGSTVYPETKGIWVWCQPHPKKHHEVLLLLDTEGLGDVMELFIKHDNITPSMWWENFLTCSYVTEMTKRIKKGKTSEIEDGRDFFTFFPNFVWIVRDFTLSLKDKAGNPITSDQYLLNALQLKEGNTSQIVAYNKRRQCIREYFADKKCFVLPQPTKDTSQFEELESLSDSQLDSKFLHEVKEFCEYIYIQSFPKTAEGQPIQGKMFCHLLETYLQSIQSGNIPCVENAVNNMAEQENSNALEASFNVYEEQMNKILQKPIDTEKELSEAHLDCYSKAMKTFMSMSILDEEGKYLDQIKKNIRQKFKDILTEWKQDHKESANSSGNIEKIDESILTTIEELDLDFSQLQEKLIHEKEDRIKQAERRHTQRQKELDEIHENLNENQSSQTKETDEMLNTLLAQAAQFHRDKENAENDLTDIRAGGESFGKYLQRTKRVITGMITGGLTGFRLGSHSRNLRVMAVMIIAGGILGGLQEFMSTENPGVSISERTALQQVYDEEQERVSEGNNEYEEKKTDFRSTDWIMEIQEIFLDEFCKEKLEVFLSVQRTDSVLTNLLQVILANNNKEAVCVMMAFINKKWKEEFGDNTISLWLGNDHRGERTGEMVLVCFHSAVALSEFSPYLGLPMIYRRFDETEMEPLENRLQEKYRTVSFNRKDADAIKRLINEHGEHLFKVHSNLEAITASSVKSTKNGIIKKTSILLYCRLKGVIPYSEEFFPKELKVDDHDYLTDIREGFFSLGMNPAQRVRSSPHPHSLNNPLRMGCSIGTSGFPFAGTLGPFVRFGDNQIGFLTCAHVLGIDSSRNQTPVVQPADIEEGLPVGDRRCGTFVREKFDSLERIGVDAALVGIDQNMRDVDVGGFVWMDSQQPIRIGMFEGNSPSFENGMVIGNPDFQNLGGQRNVCKFGRTTGLTRGSLVLENAMLKVHSATLALPDGVPLPHGYRDNNFIMRGQFLIQKVGNSPFFIPGDSGAGVYVVRRNHQGESRLALIGIAIGSLTSEECAMTPIGRVLEALGLNESDIITEGGMETNP